MIFAAAQAELWNWWMDLIHLKQEAVAQGILVGTALSSVYLLVLFFTRWGDRHTLAKALVFSSLIHFISIGGMVAVVRTPERTDGLAPPGEDIEEEEITTINLFSEEFQDLPMGGNTPIWNRLPDPVEIVIARNDQQKLEPIPLENPERQFAPPTETETAVPDLAPTRPNEQADVPKPESVEQEPGPRAPADVPLDGPEPVEIAKVEAGGSAQITRERNPIPQRGPFETQVNRAPQRGSTDEVKREIDPNRDFASIETPDDPKAYLKRGPEKDLITRRSSPAPAFGPLPEMGAPDTTGDEPGPSGVRGDNRPSRLTAGRQDGDRIDANVPRTRTDLAPRPDVPLRQREFGPAPSDTLADRSSPVPIRPQMDLPRTGRGAALPSTYRYRGVEQRRKAALKFGGTEASERAVEDALRWLAANQTPEGYWDSSEHGGGQVELTKDGLDTRGAEVRGAIPGAEADSGVTALALLAFLGAGYTQEDGPYADTVERAINWLISQQAEDGFLGGKATHYEKTYCHGMATYALAEAYGMRSDPTLPGPIREPLERALKFILDQQHPSDGGWRYRKGETGDMSIFGWNLMALKSAEIAGLPIPEANRNLLVKFLTDRSLGRYKGLSAYHPQYGAQGHNPTMTAEALFSKQMLGIQRSNPACKEAMDYLMNELPSRSNLNFYYYYYGTLATFQYGGEPWKKWNESLRDMLVDEQRVLGPDKGSWDPKDRWGGYGGRVYSTALNALVLEVYYRFLPLYQMGGLYSEQ